MIRKPKLINVMDKCRVCLSKGGCLTDIYTQDIYPKIEELVKSTSIHIDDIHGVPRRICHVCLYKLDLWYDFKEQFILSNEILLQHLKNNSKNIAKTVKRGHRSIEVSLQDINNHVDNWKKLKRTSETIEKLSPRSIKEKDKRSRSTDPLTLVSEVARIRERIVDTEDTTKSVLDSTPDDKNDIIEETRARQFGARRTNEQRRASTKRWVARKKAILAATGENDTDTDSTGIDDLSLSPIIKSRDLERTERITTPISSVPKNDNFKNLSPDKSYATRTFYSEVNIGDATFAIALNLSSHHEPSNDPVSYVSTVQKNTHNNSQDIIDVETYTIPHSKMHGLNDEIAVEQCLHIEVEATDHAALEKVLNDLAKFVQIEIPQRLNNNGSVATENKPQSFQTLEQQLKAIVEKAIRKSSESSTKKSPRVTKISSSNYHENQKFSAEFIKAAEQSPVFQPRIYLNRIEIDEEPLFLQADNNNGQEIENLSGKTRQVNIGDNIRDNKEYICGECGSAFVSKAHIQRHVLTHKKVVKLATKKSRKMRCKRFRESVNANLIKSHVCETIEQKPKIHNLCYMTPPIETQFHGNSQTKNETKQSTEIDHEIFTCFICDKLIYDKELLKSHLQRHCDDVSENEKRCKKLSSHFSSIDVEKRHSLETTQKDSNGSTNLFKTDDKHRLNRINDDYRFDNNKMQLINQESHTNVHSCLTHLESFQSEVELPLHTLVHKDEKEKSESISTVTVINNEHYKIITCDEIICNNDVYANDNSNFHDESSFICCLCDKACSSLVDLQTHVDTH